MLEKIDDFSADDDFTVSFSTDLVEKQASKDLHEFFEKNKESVFFLKQIEVQNEDRYFHWLTNRVLRKFVDSGLIRSEKHQLAWGGSINILFHRSYRYYKRAAMELVKLVNEYSDPNIGGVVGLHGESMVLEAFARSEFVMKGRNTRSYGGKTWEKSGDNLDFIFEKDGFGYGLEIKNTLKYINYEEFKLKVKICKHLGVQPVFVVRMLPRTWVFELKEQDGFALILQYQLYPWTHKDLEKRKGDRQLFRKI
jgi:hypothetical protein